MAGKMADIMTASIAVETQRFENLIPEVMPLRLCLSYFFLFKGISQTVTRACVKFATTQFDYSIKRKDPARWGPFFNQYKKWYFNYITTKKFLSGSASLRYLIATAI